MAAIGFDTHQAVKALTEVGFSKEQAEPVVSTVRHAIGRKCLATKADILDLETKMKDLELRLTIRLGGLMIAVGGLIVTLIKLLP
jgi:hypothetical protein